MKICQLNNKSVVTCTPDHDPRDTREYLAADLVAKGYGEDEVESQDHFKHGELNNLCTVWTAADDQKMKGLGLTGGKKKGKF